MKAGERFILTPYDRTRDRIRDTETYECDYITSMAEACDRMNALAARVAELEAIADRAERLAAYLGEDWAPEDIGEFASEVGDIEWTWGYWRKYLAAVRAVTRTPADAPPPEGAPPGSET